MNKILIKCDGGNIILNTVRTVSDIVQILELNLEKPFVLIDKCTLNDEGFEDKVVINPRFVTLVKDITHKEQDVNLEYFIDGKVVAKSLNNDGWIQGLSNGVMDEIKKQQRISCGIISV
ncbi:MAG: hypothetical protein [Bacteriophage sp.]|jgi:hypothetical protein|nr:MAG: hypothetical protein [Bacteriophage sp.]